MIKFLKLIFSAFKNRKKNKLGKPRNKNDEPSDEIYPLF